MNELQLAEKQKKNTKNKNITIQTKSLEKLWAIIMWVKWNVDNRKAKIFMESITRTCAICETCSGNAKEIK